jgi:hypothetical protein
MPCKEVINEKIDRDVNEKLDEPECFQMFPNGVKMETFGNNNDSKYQCLICDKIYLNRSGLFKHKKSKHPGYDFDIKQNNEKSEIETLKELFMSQINKLEEKNKELEILVKTSKPKNKTKNITNNTNSNNTTNTNNGTINNINIVQFGREDSSLLNKEEISKILYERGIDGLLASIEVFHFNDRLPEYKNIKLKDIKSKYIDVHNGSKWQKQSKSNIIEETLDNHMYNIKSLKDEYHNKTKIKKSVSRLIDNYDQHYDLATEEKKTNKKLVKNINDEKEKICLAILNNGIKTNPEVIDV